ncbi:MAG: carbon storage regulator CsrA [Janthinobacterium lividum]
MLYISRKNGESLLINDNIKITVIEVRGKTTKFSIEHPQGTRILRQELYDRIQRENQQAYLSAQFLKEA